MNTPPRPLAVLLGTHRSLSTCLAECCQRLGCFLGEGRGGEDRQLAWLCETLFPFPARECPVDRPARVTLLRRWLRDHLARAGERLAACKYPTLCFLAAELAEACAAEGVKPVWIDCARALPESMASLVTRSRRLRDTWVAASPREAEALQIALFREKWAFLRHHRHHRVVADRLLADPAAELAALVAVLGPHGLAADRAALDAAAATVARDRAPHSGPAVRRAWTDECTVVVKTHERPDCLHDLLVSLRAWYPGAQVLVADDSRRPQVHHGADHYFARPDDEGLSAGRNFLVAHCQTPYCLLLDDDMVVSERTDLQALYEVATTEGWDVVAGGVRRLSPFVAWRGHFAFEHRDGRRVCRLQGGPAAVTRGGRPRYDFVDNFFVARVDALRRCPWDPQLKVGEHLDWGFRSTFGVEPPLRCTALPEVTILDRVHRTSRRYLAHRARARRFRDQSICRWARRLHFQHLQNDFHPPSSYEVPR